MKEFIWEQLKKYIGRPVKRFYTRKTKELKTNSLKVLTKPYLPPQTTYKNIITTNGFGHSGSGVIIDLMSEFDNTTVIGAHDLNGGSPLSKDKNVPKIEYDFVRLYGGVMDLESAFDEHSVGKSIKLLNFINLSEYFYKQKSCAFYSDKYMELTNDFIDKLTFMKFESKFPIAGNDAFMFEKGFGNDYINLQSPFTYEYDKKKYSYFVKNLTREEYRKLAHEYIVSVLNTMESKENLVMDAFVSDAGFDLDFYEQYVGPFKMITVRRDPRDVYMQGVILNEPWIPRDKEQFVQWFKYSHDRKYMKEPHKNSLVLRFEDLVLHYDETMPKIYEFLNIDKSHHIKPKTQFRPEYSKKNIGLYKTFENQEIIKYIEDNLKEYCYYDN